MPTPTDVVLALQMPEFWQNKEFWPMCNFLFQQHEGNLVWKSLRPESMRQLLLHLSARLDSCHENPPAVVSLIDPVYFLVVEKVRGQRSNQEFHAGESRDFIFALYNVYKYLRAHSPKSMPNFGDPRHSV